MTYNPLTIVIQQVLRQVNPPTTIILRQRIKLAFAIRRSFALISRSTMASDKKRNIIIVGTSAPKYKLVTPHTSKAHPFNCAKRLTFLHRRRHHRILLSILPNKTPILRPIPTQNHSPRSIRNRWRRIWESRRSPRSLGLPKLYRAPKLQTTRRTRQGA